jgi:hypothetical protein
MIKLEPITYDEDLYDKHMLNGDFDIESTDLTLSDYDWMVYTLKAALPVKPYGDINIEFVYIGTIYSEMKVKTSDRIYLYEFDSDIYKKFITKFLTKHIAHWKKKKGFSGTCEVIEFYNTVISDPRTKEKWSRKRRIYVKHKGDGKE